METHNQTQGLIDNRPKQAIKFKNEYRSAEKKVNQNDESSTYNANSQNQYQVKRPSKLTEVAGDSFAKGTPQGLNLNKKIKIKKKPSK